MYIETTATNTSGDYNALLCNEQFRIIRCMKLILSDKY